MKRAILVLFSLVLLTAFGYTTLATDSTQQKVEKIKLAKCNEPLALPPGSQVTRAFDGADGYLKITLPLGTRLKVVHGKPKFIQRPVDLAKAVSRDGIRFDCECDGENGRCSEKFDIDDGTVECLLNDCEDCSGTITPS